MKGSVKVTKVFRDGREELVCKDDNILTDGLGVTLADLLTDSGDRGISDRIAGYFQVGLGKHNPQDLPASIAKYISTLDSPLASQKSYGKDAEIKVDTHKLISYHATNMSPAYAEGFSDSVFAFLPDSKSTQIIDGVVNYRLTLTENMGNNLGADITEFGLFTRNSAAENYGAKRLKDNQSVLIAYKNLDGAEGEGVRKTSDFSLVIDWQIKFVDSPVSEDPLPPPSNNVVFIMIDDVGVDQLGMYDAINAYSLGENGNHANATPFSQLEDTTNGSGIYPHTPMLSALAAGGMTFFNSRSQPACSPTRATILTGKYNFGVGDYRSTAGNKKNLAPGEPIGFWGGGYGIVGDTNWLKRGRGGMKGLNDGYGFIQQDGTQQSLANAVRDDNGALNNIVNQPLITDYLRSMNYNSSLFGKWHLAAWSEQKVYCEQGDGVGGDNKYGSGWEHIALKGKWDHYTATFSNLNTAPVPGLNYNSGAWENPSEWPHFNGAAPNSTDGKQMGYVNYTVNTNGVETTVSDTGYRTYKQVNGTTPYEQGDPSSFTTNYIFSQASAYFNTAQEPFFMYITPNTPHTPYTYPPSSDVYNSYYNNNNRYSDLSAGMNAGNSVSSNWVATNAMLETFDKALSGFIDNLDQSRKDNTIFIFTSDNGSLSTDLARRATWCSSLGLGAEESIGGSYAGSGGFGSTYDKMLNLGAYCSSLTPSAVRRGGENDSANTFKGSLYDRAMLVPMIASGPGISAGSTTSGLVDLNDLLATVVDIGGGLTNFPYDVPPDSISFKDLMFGNVDSSSHPRQYSFGEIFFPIGNASGDPANAGTYTGFVNCGELEVPNDIVEDPDPRVPKQKRRALSIRFKPTDFVGWGPPIAQTVINNLGLNDVVNIDEENQELPDASAGLWKIIRPNSGRVNLVNFPHNTEGEDPTFDADGNQIQPYTVGKGRLYQEMYHLQNKNFEIVDPYELNDFILEETKGVKQLNIVSSLVVSAVTNSAANGGINSAGDLNNTVYYWNVAKLYYILDLCLQQWLKHRITPKETINLVVDQQNIDDNIDEET